MYLFCPFEVIEESKNLTQCSVYSVHCGGGGRCVLNSGTLASSRPHKSSPKYNNDISLLILVFATTLEGP
jgi:hypothetical protein